MPPHWFHAFGRHGKTTAQFIVDVLQGGPKPWPGGSTEANEKVLGIDPRRLYAYGGRTHEAFGLAAFAVPQAHLTGEVSPFDTGGLVEKFAPVKDWDPDERQQYLRAYTWPSAQFASIYLEYPGPAEQQRADYLAAKAPAHAGPDAVWKGRKVAPLWQANPNQWRAWTWEIRSETFPPPAPDTMIAWTCQGDLFQEFLALGCTKPDEADWFEAVTSKWVEGGTSVLVDALRAEQLSP